MDRTIERIVDEEEGSAVSTGRRPRLLIIEPELGRARSLKGSFEERGYEAMEALSPEKARDIVNRMSFDAVLLNPDIGFFGEYASPEGGSAQAPGSGTIDYIKRIDPILPLILVSDTKDVEALENALNKGVFGYIHNPLENIEAVFSNIDQAVDTHARARRHVLTDLKFNLDFYSEIMKNRNRDGRIDPEQTARLGAIEKELMSLIIYINDRLYMDSITRFTEDCSQGSLSEIDPDISYLDSEHPRKFYNIKKTHQKKDVETLLEDYHNFSGEINMAKPLFYFEKSGYYYILSEMFPAADNAKVLSLLKAEGEGFSKLSRAIVEVILENKAKWHRLTKRKLSRLDVESIIADYASNLKNAVLSLKELTNAEIDDSEAETLVVFASSLVAELKGCSSENFGRIIDTSPSNSGLMTYRINPLLEDIIRIAEFEKPNGSYAIDKNKIRKNIRFWDIPNKMGHFLEDFFHITDSFEAGFDDETRISLYRDYLHSITGKDEAALKEQWKPYFIMGFYRNFRKMDLVMTKYACLNELEHMNGIIDDARRDERRQDYLDKISHYCSNSIKYLLGYHQFIGKENISKLGMATSLKKVTRFFRGFSEQPFGDINTEYIDGTMGVESPDIAIRMAYVLSEKSCQREIYFERVLAKKLRYMEEWRKAIGI